MMSPRQMIVEYQDLLENPHPHIRLPIGYFLRNFAEFFIWFLLASVCMYSVLYIVTVFIWLYTAYLTYLYGQIWSLYGLSKGKLLLALLLLFAIALPLGPPIRNGFTALFFHI